ncbi:uncharacterized protein DEA37_0006837 [Paragonimus westermani]|uniref:Uncharacterized protein n=1 Tax=Paragonimus westermani TaxID=34504 RepID=A0A5J4ND75_9TREM|nr:uncharacterized protein DEA37_0006837 [Paragonimus westermani]
MNDKSSDANGCLCPNNRAPTITRDSLGGQERVLASPHLSAHGESCAESLAEVSCVRNHVELCYKPPNLAPYSALGNLFLTQNAVAFVTDSRSDFAYVADCSLSAVETHRLVQPSRPSAEEKSLPAIWCIDLSWRNHPDNPPCGIHVTEYMWSFNIHPASLKAPCTRCKTSRKFFRQFRLPNTGYAIRNSCIQREQFRQSDYYTECGSVAECTGNLRNQAVSCIWSTRLVVRNWRQLFWLRQISFEYADRCTGFGSRVVHNWCSDI